MADIQALAGLEIFKSLTDGELEKVAGLMTDVMVDDGDWIFREGDPGDSLFVILGGAVDICQEIQPGVEKVLVTLPAGACFGEMVLVDPGKRSASARSSAA